MGLKSEVAVNSRPGRGGRNKSETLVKQIIEATRCTSAEAEEALQENQNDISLAVLWLLDRGESVWTEQKSRKAKKEEVERPIRTERPKRGPKGAPTSTAASGTTTVVNGSRPNNENRRPRESRPEREPRESRPEREHREPRPEREHREPRAEREQREPRVEREPREFRSEREPRGERSERSAYGNAEGGNRGRTRFGGRQPRENGTKPEEVTSQIVETTKPVAPVNSVWGGKSSFAEKVAGSKKLVIDKFDNPPLQEKPVSHNEGKDTGVWSAGQVFTRSNPVDVPGAPAPVKPAPMKNAAGPLSFAAILAQGKKPAPKPIETPAEVVLPSPAAPVNDASEVPSTTQEPSPSIHATPVKTQLVDESQAIPETSTAHSSSDATTVSQSLTSQLKNDLGLLSSSPAHAAPTSTLISAAPSSSTPTSVNAGRGTVEFVSNDLNATNKGHTYQFGYNPEPSVVPVVTDESSFKSSIAESVAATPAQGDYARTPVETLYKPPVESTQSPSKPIVNAAAQLATYGITQQQPQQQSASIQQQQQQHSIPRRLGYAETSTVSFQPESRSSAIPNVTSVPTAAQTYKAPVTAQSAVNHPTMAALHQQHTSQQQLYNPMYGAGFPYTLYSPVAGREEHYSATPYVPYYGMDLNLAAQVLPPMMVHQQQQQQQQQQASQQSSHRNDHHQNYSDMKSAYGQQSQQNSNTTSSNLSSTNQRDSNLSSSNVAPPPGFAGPPTAAPNAHMFHNMFQQFMPTKVNHMYGQQGLEDSSSDYRQQHQSKMYSSQDKYQSGNVRDRMNIGAAQPTPPPQGSYGQQSYSNSNNMLSKKPYHQQWAN